MVIEITPQAREYFLSCTTLPGETMRFLSLTLFLLMAGGAQAAIQTETFEYKDDGTRFVGYLAYDDAAKGKRPGVLVIPEWWGLNDYARKRARDIAKLGYVGLAIDMYGDGRSTTDPKLAGEWAGSVRGTPLMRKRAQSGLKVLGKFPLVDDKRLGAIGFCFGGTGVLELAYSGARLAGVVSFHGNLPVPTEKEARKMKASVLVLHGADDPYVKPEEMNAFQAAMSKGKADWQLVSYGGALHSFSNPDADRIGFKGVGYDKLAEKRSWTAMRQFFAERFEQ
jgi:dienelactone hydrolase